MQRSFESPTTNTIFIIDCTVHLHGVINNSIIVLSGGLPSNIHLGLSVNSENWSHKAFYICKQGVSV